MNTIFLKILDMSFMASWLMIAVILLRFLLKKAPRWIVCMLWILVGVRLVFPFALESDFSLVPSSEPVSEVIRSNMDINIAEPNLPGEVGQGDDSPKGGISDMNRFEMNPADMNEPGTITPGEDIPVNDVAESEFANSDHMDTGSTNEQADLFQTGDSDDMTSPTASLDSIINTLGIVWLMGVVLMLLYGFISYYRLHRITAASMEINTAADEVVNAGTGKNAEAGATTNKNVFQCDAIDTPFILGIIRPRIYLPSNMEDSWTDYVIAHEKTHIRRRDHWWKPMGFLILSVYWFNPLCWLSYILLCRDIELACDEAVIKTMDSYSKKIYAKALLSCSVKQKMITACPLAFGEIGIKERIRGVMNYKKPAFWIIAISLLACVVVAVCFLTNPRTAADTEGNDTETGEGMQMSDGSGEIEETDASNFEYLYDEELGGVVITGYIGEDTMVSVPGMIDGNYVVKIGDDAFGKCISLTDIIIPDSVTKIGDRAFNQCDSLKNVSLPEGLTTIGDYAFNQCYGLTDIRIPGSVTDMGDHALNRCDNLTDITIHGSLIDFEPANRDDLLGVLYGILYGCRTIENVNILEGTTTIEASSFRYCSNLLSVTIPDTVMEIKDHAFYYCTFLTEITIPDSVTYIGNNVFERCSSLTHVELPESIDPDNFKIASSAFARCTSLEEITLPDGITSLNANTFYECESLKNIIIPDSVTEIGSGAFLGCSSLTEITLPEGITSIGDHAFKNCVNLTSINIPDGVTEIGEGAFLGCSSLPEIILPDGITSLEAAVFTECKNLTGIVIPDSVTRIGAGAFAFCDGLTDITIPDSVTTIEHEAFYRCTSLTSVTLSDSLIFIGALAFQDCSGLTDITIPDSVTTIETGAFSNCFGLTNIKLPNGITELSSHILARCDSLTEVTIPDSITIIDEWAFIDCSGLTNIVLPDGVGYIGDDAFLGCTNLTVTYRGQKFDSSNFGDLYALSE